MKREYAYTTGALGSATKTINYGYGNSEWKDLLTSYRGLSIEYDRVGNPLTFDGATLTWEQGRKLSSITLANGATVSYKYDANGIRTQKTVAGVTTDYFLQGSTIIAQKTGNNVIWYYFDGDGTRDAIEYNGNVYYYMYNPQGDVIGLFDDNLNVVVEYRYDSWGKILSITGSLASTLGQDNPFRYRGYYYDNETGLYYLNSRYYHPEIGRFINADGYVQTGQGLLDKNMFAYCANNPVMFCDPSGCCYEITIPAVGDMAPVMNENYIMTSSKNSDGTYTFTVVPTRGDYNDYLDALGMMESSDNYATKNRYGYLGRYQMGTVALQDAGFMDSSNNWTALANSYGIYSEKDFLNSPNIQDVAITAFYDKVRIYITSYGLEKYIGTTYQGVVITQSGLLAACHLVGARNVRDALSNNQDITDANETSAYTYMKKFGYYNVSKVW